MVTKKLLCELIICDLKSIQDYFTNFDNYDVDNDGLVEIIRRNLSNMVENYNYIKMMEDD